MKLPQFFKEATLPWTLIGMYAVFLILSWIFGGISCPKEGSFYLAAPGGMHVAHSYYYGCGGATVGFTRNIDIDGETVFSTYGSGAKSAEVSWLTERELQITFLGERASIQEFQSAEGDISVRLVSAVDGEPISQNSINAAREAAGY